jgi:hypothetical protein
MVEKTKDVEKLSFQKLTCTRPFLAESKTKAPKLIKSKFAGASIRLCHEIT